jgi:uncharacterized delta-60 repeat protein
MLYYQSISQSLRLIYFFIALFFLPHAVLAQQIDPAFSSPVVVRHGETHLIVPAANGKVYVAGDFNLHGNKVTGELVRLTPGGFLDTSFNPDIPRGILISSLEVLPNGNLLVLADYEITGGNTIYALAVDGRLIMHMRDLDYPTTVESLPDNRFLVGTGYGEVHLYSKTFQPIKNQLCRTSGYIQDIELQGSKFLVSGQLDYVYDGVTKLSHDRKNIARFNMDGSIDLSFNGNAVASTYGAIPRMAVQPDGKIIPLNNYLQFSRGNVRMNANGSRDTGFTYGYPPDWTIEDAYYRDGKITVSTKAGLVRLLENGSRDNSFQPVPLSSPLRIAVMADLSIIAGNYTPSQYGFVKFNPDGTLNTSYNGQLTRYGQIFAMDRTAASIYIAGDFIRVNGHFTRNVARLNPNGTVLTKFVAKVEKPVLDIEAFSDARAIISTSTNMYRLAHDGRIDPSFSFTPIADLPAISKFIVQADGRILVGGPFKLFRLNSNGARDNSFSAPGGSSGGSGWFDFDLDRSTGKIIFASCYSFDHNPGVREYWRLNPNGSKDASFNHQINFTSPYFGVERVLVLDDQEILNSSITPHYDGNRSYETFKLNPDGSVNSEFLMNYENRQHSVSQFEFVHRFGDRLILTTNYFYSSSALSEYLHLDGRPDDAFAFPSDVTIKWLNNYYSDNTTELFVLGQTSVAGNSRFQQIAKFVYDPALTTTGTALAAVSFFPNPVKDQMTITVENRSIVTIYDFQGARRIARNVSTGYNVLGLTELGPGRYMVEISDGKTVYREHFVKE